jgi:hypothetical protein
MSSLSGVSAGGIPRDRGGASKQSDKTKKRKVERRNSRMLGGSNPDSGGGAQLFSLRIIEWGISPCRNWISQSGFLHGVGPFKFKWRRIADADNSLLQQVSIDQTQYKYLKV